MRLNSFQMLCIWIWLPITSRWNKNGTTVCVGLQVTIILDYLFGITRILGSVLDFEPPCR